jgi:hypothetical protein
LINESQLIMAALQILGKLKANTKSKSRKLSQEK